jgi:hypothetical protein
VHQLLTSPVGNAALHHAQALVAADISDVAEVLCALVQHAILPRTVIVDRRFLIEVCQHSFRIDHCAHYLPTRFPLPTEPNFINVMSPTEHRRKRRRTAVSDSDSDGPAMVI